MITIAISAAIRCFFMHASYQCETVTIDSANGSIAGSLAIRGGIPPFSSSAEKGRAERPFRSRCFASARIGTMSIVVGYSGDRRGAQPMEEDRIVAVGLLTQADLTLLGPTFARAYRIDETPCFDDLLRAIDLADRDARAARRSEADRERPE